MSAVLPLPEPVSRRSQPRHADPRVRTGRGRGGGEAEEDEDREDGAHRETLVPPPAGRHSS